MLKKKNTPIVAETIRRLLDAWALGKKLDPWLPFPQTMCCFSFGEERKPLPIGALRVLWSKYPEFKKPCLECGSDCYGVAFGGLMSTGGIYHVCIHCDTCWLQVIGSMFTIGALVSSGPLKRTPYKLKGAMLGGAFSSDGAELIKQLGIEGQAESLGKIVFSIDLENSDRSSPAQEIPS